MSPSGEPYPPRLTGRGAATAGPSSLSLLSLRRPISPSKTISKEEQGDYIEKRFSQNAREKPSSGARRHRIAQRGVEVTLAGDKWEVGGKKLSLGWGGWGADCAYGICEPFTLVLLSFPQKVRTEMAIVSEDARESLFRRSWV